MKRFFKHPFCIDWIWHVQNFHILLHRWKLIDFSMSYILGGISETRLNLNWLLNENARNEIEFDNVFVLTLFSVYINYGFEFKRHFNRMTFNFNLVTGTNVGLLYAQAHKSRNQSHLITKALIKNHVVTLIKYETSNRNSTIFHI